MKSSIQPRSGYKAAAKATYRELIWSAFHRNIIGDVGCANVLILPGPTDQEIRLALDNGVTPERLWILDKSPAVVAVHKRSYKKINAIGLLVSESAKRLEADGFWGAKQCFLNLDFCGIATSIQSEIGALFGPGNWPKSRWQVMVGLNMQRGRDPKAIADPASYETDPLPIEIPDGLPPIPGCPSFGREALTRKDGHRIGECIDRCAAFCDHLASGIYKSDRVSMLWTLQRLIQPTAVECFLAMATANFFEAQSSQERMQLRDLGYCVPPLLGRKVPTREIYRWASMWAHKVPTIPKPGLGLCTVITQAVIEEMLRRGGREYGPPGSIAKMNAVLGWCRRNGPLRPR